MKLNPEVQAKAQEELDRVLGDRLPVAADKESLPYPNAILLETFQWHPSGPNGADHPYLLVSRGLLTLLSVLCT